MWMHHALPWSFVACGRYCVYSDSNRIARAVFIIIYLLFIINIEYWDRPNSMAFITVYWGRRPQNPFYEFFFNICSLVYNTKIIIIMIIIVIGFRRRIFCFLIWESIFMRFAFKIKYIICFRWPEAMAVWFGRYYFHYEYNSILI